MEKTERKSKRVRNTSLWKFYLADNALRYIVHIGKTNDGEIDFVATRQNDKLYVQVKI